MRRESVETSRFGLNRPETSRAGWSVEIITSLLRFLADARNTSRLIDAAPGVGTVVSGGGILMEESPMLLLFRRRTCTSDERQAVRATVPEQAVVMVSLDRLRLCFGPSSRFVGAVRFLRFLKKDPQTIFALVPVLNFLMGDTEMSLDLGSIDEPVFPAPI